MDINKLQAVINYKLNISLEWASCIWTYAEDGGFRLWECFDAGGNPVTEPTTEEIEGVYNNLPITLDNLILQNKIYETLKKLSLFDKIKVFKDINYHALKDLSLQYLTDKDQETWDSLFREAFG